ncbi:MAG: hypothetical protein OEZ06_25735 [Myxococcales bacterium]|nr:hypothetical protein [Myxococcales bacterium]
MGACLGGDDGGGGGSFNSGVPASTSLASLSSEQAVQTCEAFGEKAMRVINTDSQIDVECTSEALVVSISPDGSGNPVVDVQACEQAFAQCKANGGPAGSDPMDSMAEFDCDPSNALDEFVDCDPDATVADLEDCLNAMLDSINTALSGFTCEAFSDPAALQNVENAGPEDPSLLPECAAVEAKCPNFDIGGGSESTAVASGDGSESCNDSCGAAFDGVCDDGGAGSETSFCALGSDCNDCGPR